MEPNNRTNLDPNGHSNDAVREKLKREREARPLPPDPTKGHPVPGLKK